ncbi:hypothetical protein CEXT_754271 [Caerostris extrusa]|uniref:Uncharacterized protein n=1 Tax=Caerostris extrusa TaxID=172846 RepID=A0AAV4XIT0_CAEEX|nr:hypothetical protein CEXT_754271 [Caerostris extrusa]
MLGANSYAHWGTQKWEKLSCINEYCFNLYYMDRRFVGDWGNLFWQLFTDYMVRFPVSVSIQLENVDIVLVLFSSSLVPGLHKSKTRSQRQRSTDEIRNVNRVPIS